MNPHQQLQATIIQFEGAYAPATIRTYDTDFAAFIRFCDSKNCSALPASPVTLAEFISFLSKGNKSSASIRRAVVGILAMHTLNHYAEPTKEAGVKLEMRRMHRTLGRAAKQAYGIDENLLNQLLNSITPSLRGLRDMALLLLAYDTLCRRSELITLRITDIQTRELANKAHHTILLRRGKVDQESHGRRLALQSKTVLAINHWLSEAKINGGFILRAVKRNDRVSESLCSGQINRIYKRLAQQANIDPAIVQNISGHSCRVGAAQSLLASGASMPMIMNRGRWSKTDTVMRYLEQYGSGY